MDKPPRFFWARILIEPPWMEPRGPVCVDTLRGEASNGCPPGAPVLGDAAAMPGLCNSHLHLLDAAVADAGEDLGLHELVAQPHGLKYRLLRAAPRERLLQASIEALSLSKRRGVLLHGIYAELGEQGASIAGEAAASAGVEARILPQPLEKTPGELEELLYSYGALGLDTPLDHPEPRLLRGKGLIHVHVSEDPALAGLGDAEAALEMGAAAAIHVTGLSVGRIIELAREGVAPVYCPRSNLYHGALLPPLEALPLLHEEQLPAGIGSDNAAWPGPDLALELEAAYTLYRARLSPGLREALARALLYAATVGCQDILGIENQWLVVVRVPLLGYSQSPPLAVVKRLAGGTLIYSSRGVSWRAP